MEAEEELVIVTVGGNGGNGGGGGGAVGTTTGGAGLNAGAAGGGGCNWMLGTKARRQRWSKYRWRGGGGSHYNSNNYGGSGGSGIVVVRDTSKDLKDSTGLYNLRPVGTTVVDGFYGKGRSFNGSSDRISQNNGNNVNVTGDISIEMWINPASFATTVTPIHKDNQYSIQIDTSGNVYWADSSNWNYGAFGATNIGLLTNQWQYLVFTKTGGVVNIYLNGVLKASKYFGGALTSTTSIMHIGCYANEATCTGAYFNGKLDEIRISNVARTADAIADTYRAGRDHRISRTIPTANVSSATKIPFSVASDRPGTFMEATIGNSAYANYESDANTVGLWHLDELGIGGTGGMITDSGGYRTHTFKSSSTFISPVLPFS